MLAVFVSTFESVATLVGIGLFGFYIIKQKVLSRQILEVLSPLILDIALSCYTFVFIIINFSPQENPGWGEMLLWLVVFTILAGLGSWFFVLFAKKENRKEFF